MRQLKMHNFLIWIRRTTQWSYGDLCGVHDSCQGKNYTGVTLRVFTVVYSMVITEYKCDNLLECKSEFFCCYTHYKKERTPRTTFNGSCLGTSYSINQLFIMILNYNFTKLGWKLSFHQCRMCECCMRRFKYYIK